MKPRRSRAAEHIRFLREVTGLPMFRFEIRRLSEPTLFTVCGVSVHREIRQLVRNQQLSPLLAISCRFEL